MAVVAADTVTVSMGLPCDHDTCEKHALPLYEQLDVPRYSRGASVLRCPDTLEEWRAEHRTARRRALRAERLGYMFAEVDFSEHGDDIYDINVSLPNRQGRPMDGGYTVRREHGALREWQTRCLLHRTHTYGVLSRGKLVAYLTLHRAGDLAMVSMILGHAEHMDAGIMFLLFQGVVAEQAGTRTVFFYNRADSGGEGLRWFKARLGFSAADIEWRLS